MSKTKEYSQKIQIDVSNTLKYNSHNGIEREIAPGSRREEMPFRVIRVKKQLSKNKSGTAVYPPLLRVYRGFLVSSEVYFV